MLKKKLNKKCFRGNLEGPKPFFQIITYYSIAVLSAYQNKIHVTLTTGHFGTIHKLRRQDFTNFWPPPPSVGKFTT